MFHSLLHFLNPQFLIQTLGLTGIFFVIFAESGLFFGFFFPGDSLLFTAGLLATSGYLPLGFLAFGACIAAVAGDSVGYWFGKKVGPKIFTKEDSFWFHKKHIDRAEHFYEEYGSKTIIFARFIPIIRTFAPIVAGVGNMKYRTFALYNILGGFLWSLGLVFGGYFLGKIIPNIDMYLLPIIFIIIVVSFIPVIVEVLRHKK